MSGAGGESLYPAYSGSDWLTRVREAQNVRAAARGVKFDEGETN